ncbi:MAG: DAK2 domain-containing protein [Spirochaetales bacterium]|jgi:dihydroxyacetone kinase-like protein|nr:DAK2 domain-containing protein [Spirochaetales bacterium]
MAEEIGKAEAAAIFGQLKAVMEKNRDELTALDAALGDGDLGMVMAKAFTLVEEKTGEIQEKASDPGRMFALAGMEIGKNAPSTMGTLIASGFMKAGKAVSGKQAVGAADMAVFIKAFADAIASLGGAKQGDKTVLDVLYPASEAASRAAREGLGLREVLERALGAAQEGLEEGRGFMARHGRPGIFREKTIGMTDPGSLAGVLILRAFCEALS